MNITNVTSTIQIPSTILTTIPYTVITRNPLSDLINIIISNEFTFLSIIIGSVLIFTSLLVKYSKHKGKSKA